MPEWLQRLSRLIPITYSLDAMRRALLTDASFQELLPDIVALIVFCVLLIPSSLLIFRYAVHRAKVDGSLAHF
jgi:ABC-2 type transport system permease protein